MRSISDDELYAVQGRYLGPPGRTLPFQARYSAYALWSLYFLIFLVVRAQLGLFRTGLGYVVIGLAATLATILTMRVVTPERPASVVVAMFFVELAAPRARARTARGRIVMTPRRVLVTATRPRSRGRARRGERR